VAANGRRQPRAGTAKVAGVPSAATPDPRRLEVWDALLRAHSMMVRTLERDLVQLTEMSWAEYDVLTHLNMVPQRRLKMRELAEAVLVTTGGITKLLDRMTRDGLVERVGDPADRRVIYAVLTDVGLKRLRHAAPIHLRGIQEVFASLLHEDEVEPVGNFLERLLDAQEQRAQGGGTG
jgi:DNA-binding MarR family transcriptional regulator